MKEEVFEKFANKALQYLEGTEAFLKEQLPDYFQQIVKYHAIEAWVFTVIGLLATLVILCFAYKASKDKDCYDPMFNAFIIGLFALLPLGLGLVTLKTALKATIAPKVFIVDYLRGKE